MKRLGTFLAALLLFPIAANAGVYLRARASTGTTTIGEQDSLVVVTALSGAKVATLPPCPSSVTGRLGQTLIVASDHTSDSPVTITAAGSDKIGASATTLSLGSADDSAWLTCEKLNHWTVGQSATLSGAASVTSLTDSGAATITGLLSANGGLDRSSAAALAIGATNATSVVVTPAMTVTGALTGTAGFISSSLTILKDSNGDVLIKQGTTVPADTTTGYAKGALFIDTDVVSGTSGLYVNVGTNTSCIFKLVTNA